jgi:transposase
VLFRVFFRLYTVSIELREEDRETLCGWVRKSSGEQRQAFRAKLILALADGKSVAKVAREQNVDPDTVSKWRDRFATSGIEGIAKDKARPGRPSTIPTDRVKAVVTLTRLTTPEDATQWSVRTMAEVANVSPSSVYRIWAANGLKPHLVRTFKLSTDPLFEEKLVDVVGLYMDPPENALVLCVDEKSQIQALDRTQPGLPMKKGRCGTMTHDYVRKGTTTLFAALDALTGKVIGTCKPQHRRQEFLEFLREIDRKTPKDLDLHLVLDNYGTHKHADVKAWLTSNPRFHFHFVPTSSSWLKMVERFFGLITQKRIRRGTFDSVQELKAAIKEFIATHNKTQRPFKWTKSAEAILQKVTRARESLAKLSQQQEAPTN